MPSPKLYMEQGRTSAQWFDAALEIQINHEPWGLTRDQALELARYILENAPPDKVAIRKAAEHAYAWETDPFQVRVDTADAWTSERTQRGGVDGYWVEARVWVPADRVKGDR